MAVLNLVADGLPPEKREVLLIWSVPGMKPIYRIGCLFTGYNSPPTWKFEMDHGDSWAGYFSRKDDEQPTYWMELPALSAAGEAR